MVYDLYSCVCNARSSDMLRESLGFELEPARNWLCASDQTYFGSGLHLDNCDENL